MMSRVYGLPSGPSGQGLADYVSKSVIINSTYKDEANFSSVDEEDHLRMVYAPGDFSDLHMKLVDSTDVDPDRERFPVIQGFVTGFGESIVSITFEFNLVLEYVPKPVLFQMVERKPAQVNASSLSKAENLVGRTDTGVNQNSLSQLRQLSEVPASDLKRVGEMLKGEQRFDY